MYLIFLFFHSHFTRAFPFYLGAGTQKKNEHIIRASFANETVNKEGMSRLPKRMQQAKRVAPPAVPEIYRHSGSSFGSAGYGSCDDTANMGGGSNFYGTANDPNNSLNVSLRSNTSNSSIDLPDNAASRLLQASPAANVSGMYTDIKWPQFNRDFK